MIPKGIELRIDVLISVVGLSVKVNIDFMDIFPLNSIRERSTASLWRISPFCIIYNNNKKIVTECE